MKKLETIRKYLASKELRKKIGLTESRKHSIELILKKIEITPYFQTLDQFSALAPTGEWEKDLNIARDKAKKTITFCVADCEAKAVLGGIPRKGGDMFRLLCIELTAFFLRECSIGNLQMNVEDAGELISIEIPFKFSETVKGSENPAGQISYGGQKWKLA